MENPKDQEVLNSNSPVQENVERASSAESLTNLADFSTTEDAVEQKKQILESEPNAAASESRNAQESFAENQTTADSLAAKSVRPPTFAPPLTVKGSKKHSGRFGKPDEEDTYEGEDDDDSDPVYESDPSDDAYSDEDEYDSRSRRSNFHPQRTQNYAGGYPYPPGAYGNIPYQPAMPYGVPGGMPPGGYPPQFSYSQNRPPTMQHPHAAAYGPPQPAGPYHPQNVAVSYVQYIGPDGKPIYVPSVRAVPSHPQMQPQFINRMPPANPVFNPPQPPVQNPAFAIPQNNQTNSAPVLNESNKPMQESNPSIGQIKSLSETEISSEVTKQTVSSIVVPGANTISDRITPNIADAPASPASTSNSAPESATTAQAPTKDSATKETDGPGMPSASAVSSSGDSPRSPINPQLAHLLNEISSLPAEEQANVISKIIAKHAHVTGQTPQQSLMLKQQIQRMIYEKGLQKLAAGVPLVGSPSSQASTPEGPTAMGQAPVQNQIPHAAPVFMPSQGPYAARNVPGFHPGAMHYAPGQFVGGQPHPVMASAYHGMGAPYGQMRPIPPGAVPIPPGHMQPPHMPEGGVVPQRPYLVVRPPTYPGAGVMPSGARPHYPPVGDRRFANSGSVKKEEFHDDLATSRPKRASSTKSVKYTYDENEDEIFRSSDDESPKTQSKSKKASADDEYAEDGQRKPKSAVKKGSRRPTDFDADFDDEIEEEEDSGAQVEKLLSYRRTEVKGEEFFVKFKGKSYIHADWIPRAIFYNEPGGSSRVKRFLSKPLIQHHYSERHIFNPSFIKVDRIIGDWTPASDTSGTVFFLVKWVDLPYESVTWETKEDILCKAKDSEPKLKEYFERKMPPMQTPFIRPSKAAWTALEESPIYKGGHTLRKYQLEGLNWLTFCWFNRQSCIIADEMGLGKTVQTVTLIDLLHSRFRLPGPFLVVAPLSTIPHWEREFSGWTNLRVITYHGSAASRDIMFDYEFFYKDNKGIPIPGVFKFDVMITTYEMANFGLNQLKNIPWKIGIFDEAHRLKNKASKATEILRLYRIDHKVLATGTPIQNSLDELFALLNFMEPNRFYDSEVFHQEYGNLRTSEDVVRLQQLLRPLMLRRLKEDVEKTIPVKEETIIEVELTAVQKRLYRAILEKNLAFLVKGAKGNNVSNMMNTMMELRKCCIHPYLIKGAEEKITEECHVTTYDDQINCMINACGKLVLLDKLLKKLRENNHRVLIFSQMTRCLDLLEDYLRYRYYRFERIDGTIRGDLRQAAIDRFCDPSSESFVFLLCTRAGGVGINLTTADTVVIFDSDWNPQNDLQAQARCHRIGQTKAVKVYRLITRGTYERDMFDRAGMKLGLDKAVLQHMGPQTTFNSTASAGANSHNASTLGGAAQLDKKEVENLLKKGAYGLVMENDEDSIKFCEEDIDQILERRTQIIKHDKDGAVAGNGEETTGHAPSIFSKASFTTSAAADDNIDLDDPNFWENWAKKLNTDSSTLQQSVTTDEPRLKRQFKRLRAFDSWTLRLEETIPTADVAAAEESNAATAESFCNVWTAAERTEFLTKFLRYGVNSERLVIDRRTPNEIYACVKTIVRFCLEAVSVEDSDTKFKQDTEKTLLGAIATVTDVNSSIAADADDATPAWLKEATFAKDEVPFPNASKKQCFEFRSFLKAAPGVFKDWIREHSYEILLRSQLIEYFRQTCDYYGIANERSNFNVPVVSGNMPHDAWTRQDDLNLLIGTLLHGFCAFDEMQFSQPSSQLPAEELIARFKKLVINMQKRSQTETRLQIQALKDSNATRRRPYHSSGGSHQGSDIGLGISGDSAPIARVYVKSRNRRNATSNSTADWETLADDAKVQFVRAVLQFGLPALDDNDAANANVFVRDWSVFKGRCGFFENYNDRALEAIAQCFINFVNQSLDGRTKKGRAASKLTLSSATATSAADASDESNASTPRSAEASPSKASVEAAAAASIGASLGDDEDVDFFALSPDQSTALNGGHVITPLLRPVIARLVLSVVEFFDRIRLDIMPKSVDVVKEAMKKIRKSHGLPKWWAIPACDIDLMRAVDRHGLFALDAVFRDTEFVFNAQFKSENPHAAAGEAAGSTTGRRRKRDAATMQAADTQYPVWPTKDVVFKRVDTIWECLSKHLQAVAASHADFANSRSHRGTPSKRTSFGGSGGRRRRNDDDDDEVFAAATAEDDDYDFDHEALDGDDDDDDEEAYFDEETVDEGERRTAATSAPKRHKAASRSSQHFGGEEDGAFSSAAVAPLPSVMMRLRFYKTEPASFELYRMLDEQ